MRYLGLAVVSALGLSVNAQDEDHLRRENTIIVTAPGPEKLAGELISNVDAISGAELISSLQGTLGDTLASRPGVSTTYFGAGASRPVLRGLGAERVLVLTNGMGVIDASAASPDHQAAGDGIDAQRIEILRGPAALAYGGQAIGGVVYVIDGLLVTELPEDQYSGQAFTAFNTVSDGGEISGRGSARFGNIVLNASLSHRDFDDYSIPGFAESERLRALEHDEDHDLHEDDDHDHEEEDHDEHEEEIRDELTNSFLKTDTQAVGLSWVGGDGYLGLAVRRQISDYGLPGHSHSHGEEDHHDEDEPDEDEHEDHAHEEEAMEAAYIDLEQVRVDFQAGRSFEQGFVRSIDLRVTSADYEHVEFEAPGEPGTTYFTDGLEARLEMDHQIGDAHGTFGVQYTDKDFRARGDEIFITPTVSESLGAFLYQGREWDNGFGVEGGLRLEQVERDNVTFGQREFDLFSGSFGIHQHWENGIFLGGQISLASRAPNESELFADGAHLATGQYEVGNAGMDIERGLNFEATARWTGENLRLGANLFHTDFNNFIYLAPGEALHDGMFEAEIDELPVYLFSQQDAEFSGGEFYASYDVPQDWLGAHWELEAGLDLVDAQLDDAGNLPFLPPASLTTDVTAEWDHLTTALSLTFAADQNDAGAGSLATDGYTLVNLSAEYDLSDALQGLPETHVFVQGRNVTDEEVRYATSVLKDQLPAPGRNVRFGLRATF